MTASAVHEGNITLDGDDIADVDCRSHKRHAEEHALGVIEEDRNAIRADFDFLVDCSARVVNAKNESSSSIESRNARLQGSADACRNSRGSDDESAFAIDEVSSRAIDIDRTGNVDGSNPGDRADLIEEEASGNRSAQSSQGKGDIEHRHTDERTGWEVDRFNSASEINLAAHCHGAGVELEVSLADREGDIWNGDRDGSDRERSGDAIGCDLEVARRIIDHHDIRAIGSEGDINLRSSDAHAAVISLLEGEVSAEGLIGNIDADIFTRDVEERSGRESERARLAEGGEALVDRGSGGVHL